MSALMKILDWRSKYR